MSYKNLFSLEGKTAVVVGAASGIGQAAAKGLADFGAKVVVADMNLKGAEQTAQMIREAGGVAEVRMANLSDAASVTALFTGLEKVDVMVCTPAINVRKRLLDYTDEEFDKVVGLNLKGNFRLLREAGRFMKNQGSGSIIVFSSIRSLVVEPGQGIYAATKAGVLQIVKTLAAELAEYGVR
ncbi:MAG: hypothetical protein RLZZ156_1325, partial [Deinococcota bacterium]